MHICQTIKSAFEMPEDSWFDKVLTDYYKFQQWYHEFATKRLMKETFDTWKWSY